jgi:hypothetical protein
MSEMLSADQTFLTNQEYLKIIQQSEKSNFTDKQLVDLLLWAQNTVMRYEMLCQFFENAVEIKKIENGEPFFSLTEQGIKMAELADNLDSEDNNEGLEDPESEY